MIFFWLLVQNADANFQSGFSRPYKKVFLQPYKKKRFPKPYNKTGFSQPYKKVWFLTLQIFGFSTPYNFCNLSTLQKKGFQNLTKHLFETLQKKGFSKPYKHFPGQPYKNCNIACTLQNEV